MSNPQPHSPATLAERLLDALPQTQCNKCGYAGCRPYAEAMAGDQADHNRCPPGGAEGIARLARILGRPAMTLDPESGVELPRVTAIIDPQRCIGCTLCIQACPVDAIVGAPKQMHVVLAGWCTGCDLCVPPCPVDCIDLVTVSGERTGWDAWSEDDARLARERHEFRSFRLQREKAENDARLAAKASAKLAALEQETASGAEQQQALDRKKAIIAAALERARQQRAALEAARPDTPAPTDPDPAR